MTDNESLILDYHYKRDNDDDEDGIFCREDQEFLGKKHLAIIPQNLSMMADLFY